MSSVQILFDQKVPADHVKAVNEYLSTFPVDGAPAILSLEHLSILIGFTVEAVFGMTNSPASYYRTFSVRKSSGGSRRIDAPLPTLLKAQRWILENILETQDCHPAAKAYVKGSSIKSNARLHRAQACILNVDVENFFGSISEHQVTSIFEGIGYRRSVAIGLAKICCLDGVLPQGAATSGYLSNLLLHDFDVQLLKFCRDQNLRYSRYADDITVSGSRVDTNEVMKKIARLLNNKGLKINKKKTNIMRPNCKQKITGIIVNERLSVEKKFLKSIRQEVYFIQKFGIFGHARHIKSKNPRATLDRLLGQVSHALFIRTNDKALKRMKNDLLEERKSAFGI